MYTVQVEFTLSLGLFSEYNVIAAATLTCVFLSSNSFVMAAISSGSRTASRGGLGPLDLSNIIPVHTRNNIKMYLLFNHPQLYMVIYSGCITVNPGHA